MSNFGRYILMTLGLFCMSLATLIGVATLSILVDGSSDSSVSEGASGATASAVIVVVMAVPIGFIVWLGRYLLRKARNGKIEAGGGANLGSIFLLLAGIIIGLTGISLEAAMVTVELQNTENGLFTSTVLMGLLIVAIFFAPPSAAAIWLSLSIMKARRNNGIGKKEKAPAPTKVPSSSSQYRMVGGEREPMLIRPEKVPASSKKQTAASAEPETLTCSGCGAKKTALAGEAAICDYCGTALR